MSCMKQLGRSLATVAAGAVMLLGTIGAAQAWPDRAITVIVPYPAGGGTDAVARTVAPILEKQLKQAVNVINRAGGGGIGGHEAIANAAPDGYTLGFITNDLSSYKWVGVATISVDDLMPLGQTNEIPASITVKIDSPYQTLPQLIDAIRAQPGKLRGTGAAPGTSWHMGMLGMLLSLNIDVPSVVWVPSQGGTLGHQDVAAGGVEFSASSLVEARALIEAKKIRALAYMSDARSELFPEVPTLKEAVNSDWTFAVMHGFGGPKALPKSVTDILVPAIKAAHASPEVQGALKQRGFRAIYRTPEEHTAVLKKDFEDMGKVLKAAGLAAK